MSKIKRTKTDWDKFTWMYNQLEAELTEQQGGLSEKEENILRKMYYLAQEKANKQ
jgi:hypothetical protein